MCLISARDEQLYAFVRTHFLDAVKQGDVATAAPIFAARGEHYLEEPLFFEPASEEQRHVLLTVIAQANIPDRVFAFTHG